MKNLFAEQSESLDQRFSYQLSLPNQLEKQAINNKYSALLQHLLNASQAFDCSGEIKIAEVLNKTIENMLNMDPVTDNLNQEEMIENLKDVGWVFPNPKDIDNLEVTI